ncbi:hypothetical protein [Pantoea sp. App145]|uniref:hypothetical protein n=2 Tax=Pantoea TaxID=53335 RepID=UPI0001B3F57D|nr:conserved hypothetical protein [Pantoea sp. At-9b]
MMSTDNQQQRARDRLAEDVADIDDTLTELFLRIHAMRQYCPRDSDSADLRLTMLAVEDIHRVLTDASRRAARLRSCLRG